MWGTPQHLFRYHPSRLGGGGACQQSGYFSPRPASDLPTFRQCCVRLEQLFPIPPLTCCQAKMDATALSADGTALFQKGDYVGALGKYRSALEVGGDAVTLHRNLCAVYLKLQQYGEALEAANICLGLQPTDAKARYRMAQVRLRLCPITS